MCSHNDTQMNALTHHITSHTQTHITHMRTQKDIRYCMNLYIEKNRHKKQSTAHSATYTRKASQKK